MMTVAALRRLKLAALLVNFLPTLAFAEGTQAPSAGRAWTDPPARDAAETRAAAKVEVPPAPDANRQAAAPAKSAVRRTVAVARTPRPVGARSAPRTRIVTRPAAPRRQVAGTARRMRVAAPAPVIRAVTMRPAAYAAPPPVIRYGYVVEGAPARSVMYEDERARRIRQAQEAGYLVVRSRSVEFPDGRRLRTYRPLDEDADD